MHSHIIVKGCWLVCISVKKTGFSMAVWVAAPLQ